MICDPCKTAADLLFGTKVPAEGSAQEEWFKKAHGEFADVDKVKTEDVARWLHDQCPGVQKDKTWCDCAHDLISNRRRDHGVPTAG